MNHTDTTSAPQWAIDAAREYAFAKTAPHDPIADLASIIAKHAPTLPILDDDGVLALATKDAEIARLRESMQRIRKCRTLPDAVLIACVSGSDGEPIVAQE